MEKEVTGTGNNAAYFCVVRETWEVNTRDGTLCIQLGFSPAALTLTNAVSGWSCDGIVKAAQLEASPNRGRQQLYCSCRTSPCALSVPEPTYQCKITWSSARRTRTSQTHASPRICSCNCLYQLSSLSIGFWSFKRHCVFAVLCNCEKWLWPQ